MQKKMKNEKIQGVQAGNMEREQETKEFLKQFYESPEAEEDTIAAKLKRTFVPKGKKTKVIADFAKDLMGEGGAGDVVIDDDMFEADTEGYTTGKETPVKTDQSQSVFASGGNPSYHCSRILADRSKCTGRLDRSGVWSEKILSDQPGDRALCIAAVFYGI